jgi:hypothetical protein
MNALEQFVAYANAQDARIPIPVETASGHRTGRDPSLRLGFSEKYVPLADQIYDDYLAEMEEENNAKDDKVQ